MPRGGVHKGTLKPQWNAGKTTTIRVPIANKDRILSIAKVIDQFQFEPLIIEKDKYQAAMDILLKAMDLPRNNGSKYRAEIKKALDLLEEDYER